MREFRKIIMNFKVVVFFSLISTALCNTCIDTSQATCATTLVPTTVCNDIQFIYSDNQTPDTIISGATPTCLTKPKIYLLIHGWIECANKTWELKFRDALIRKDPNIGVIRLDWSAYAVDNDYNRAAASIYCIADNVVNNFILPFLHTQCGLNLNTNLVVFGHSLGAQMAGIIGQGVITHGLELGSIVASDPADFQCFDIDKRLDASDANQVMVIHTCACTIGYCGDAGTVDYYVNGGKMVQPGCWVLPVSSYFSYLWMLLLDTVFGAPVSLTFAQQADCSHQYAIEYFIDSINSWSTFGFLCGDCSTCASTAVFGYPAVYTNVRGSYTVNLFRIFNIWRNGNCPTITQSSP